jgi:predicted nucleic acid-binding protein
MKGREKFLVDSVILIDHLNGVVKATNWLKSHSGGEAVISVITRAEVLAGATEKEKHLVMGLLDKFECLPLEPRIADSAAELRRAKGWKLPDAFQAALAIENSLDLVTRNTKDFNPAKNDFVLVPYSP